MGVVFDDDFSDSPAADVTTRAPDTGTGWTEVTGWGSDYFEADNGVGACSTDITNTALMILADDAPATADYVVEMTVNSPGNAADRIGIAGRYTGATQDGYIFIGRPSANGLYRLDNDVDTELVDIDYVHAVDDVVTLHLESDGVRVELNGGSEQTSTDTTITQVGQGGICGGAWISSSHDCNPSNSSLKRFRITEADAGGAPVPPTGLALMGVGQ